MKAITRQILLPVTIDTGFWRAAEVAIFMASQSKSHITLLVVDDESPPHERTHLPFHETQLLHQVSTLREVKNRVLSERILQFHDLSTPHDLTVSQIVVVGHSATQVLLLSRFQDLIIMSDSAEFADEAITKRKTAPLLEILDQTLIPVLLTGENSPITINRAALYFDGGPCASRALHGLASILSFNRAIPIDVRVAKIEHSIATLLIEQTTAFFESRGFTHLSGTYSEDEPLTMVPGTGETDLVALGIRSRQQFNDLRIGVLASHFLESEPNLNKLFC